MISYLLTAFLALYLTNLQFSDRRDLALGALEKGCARRRAIRHKVRNKYGRKHPMHKQHDQSQTPLDQQVQDDHSTASNTQKHDSSGLWRSDNESTHYQPFPKGRIGQAARRRHEARLARMSEAAKADKSAQNSAYTVFAQLHDVGEKVTQIHLPTYRVAFRIAFGVALRVGRLLALFGWSQPHGKAAQANKTQ